MCYDKFGKLFTICLWFMLEKVSLFFNILMRLQRSQEIRNRSCPCRIIAIQYASGNRCDYLGICSCSIGPVSTVDCESRLSSSSYTFTGSHGADRRSLAALHSMLISPMPMPMPKPMTTSLTTYYIAAVKSITEWLTLPLT